MIILGYHLKKVKVK